MNSKSTQIQDQINAIDAQIQAERTQAQTKAVNAIQLPLDYNDLFVNSAANDTIIEIVREFQTKAYADHNAEIEAVYADWKTNVNELKADIFDLQTRLEQEALKAHYDAKEITGWEQRYAQLLLDKQDAESKRDNAANELANANAEIYRLTQLIATPAPEPKAVEISTNDRLTELAAKAKQSAADNAARAVARWNESNPTFTVPALDIPSLPQVAEEPAAAETPQTEVPTAVPSVDGNGDSAQVVGAEAETTVTRAEHEALKARVTALESGSAKAAA